MYVLFDLVHAGDSVDVKTVRGERSLVVPPGEFQCSNVTNRVTLVIRVWQQQRQQQQQQHQQASSRESAAWKCHEAGVSAVSV
jgi:hypothetical protein